MLSPGERKGNAGVEGKRRRPMINPKTDPSDNGQKNPDDWVSGDDPMTGAQASHLKTLCE